MGTSSNKENKKGRILFFILNISKKKKKLTLRVYDTSDGSILCESTEELKSNLGFIKGIRKKLPKMLASVNNSCFDLSFPVVRALDKNKEGKVKKLLIAAGRSHNMKPNLEIEIYQTLIETVGTEEFLRREKIATGKVKEVEDKNFSILKITKGGAKLREALKNEETLSCQTKN